MRAVECTTIDETVEVVLEQASDGFDAPSHEVLVRLGDYMLEVDQAVTLAEALQHLS
jgi:hypothetical protein